MNVELSLKTVLTKIDRNLIRRIAGQNLLAQITITKTVHVTCKYCRH